MLRYRNDYIFKGKHALYLKDLTEAFGKNRDFRIFERNLDVLILAPIIGFLNKRLSNVDNSDNIVKVTINSTQISQNQEKILDIYRVIMLKDEDYERNYEKRIEKAFKFIDFPANEEDLKHFEKYILGGVEILHEEIISKGKTSEDYILNLITFVNEFEFDNSEIEIDPDCL